MKRTLLIAAAACVLATMALAQSSAFSYQGRLTSAGVAYSGSADLQISVFDAASGGTLISGPLTITNVAVTAGIYSITPDFGPIFGGAPRWLEVSVRTPSGAGTYTTVLPRQPVNAAPVATSLAGTSSLSGIDISQPVVTNIVGSQPPTLVFQTFKPGINGRLMSVSVQYGVPGPYTLPLTLEDENETPIASTTSSVTKPGNYNVVFSFNAPPVLKAGTTYRLILSAGDGVTTPTLNYASTNPYPGGMLDGDPSSDVTFSTTMDSMGIRFDHAASVADRLGVGTTTPATSLHVANADGITIGGDPNVGDFTAMSISLTSESGGAGQIQAIQFSGSAYGNLLLNPIAGNVGVGRTDPSYRLDVLNPGNGNVLRLASSASTTTMSLVNSAPGGRTYDLSSINTGTLTVRDSTALVDRLSLFPSGRIAIGFNSAPDARLEVRGESSSTALSAKSGPGSGAIGLYASGTGPGVKAALFDGSVTINGNLVVNGAVSKTSGSFRIPHPLDPEHRWLSHSFVESPDMMNIYNGVVTLNEKGEADIELPDYFQVLNRDFRYQLTPIGAPMPNLFVAREVEHNSFAISGGKPGAKVSWSVTGIRQDEKAKSHPIVVDREKDPVND